MNPCQCEQCAAVPGPTFTENFRHACEVRHVANLPSKSARKRYLAGVLVQRGKPSADRLLEGLRAMPRKAA